MHHALATSFVPTKQNVVHEPGHSSRLVFRRLITYDTNACDGSNSRTNNGTTLNIFVNFGLSNTISPLSAALAYCISCLVWLR